MFYHFQLQAHQIIDRSLIEPISPYLLYCKIFAPNFSKSRSILVFLCVFRWLRPLFTPGAPHIIIIIPGEKNIIYILKLH